MAATYGIEQGARDTVRLLATDIDTENALLQDEDLDRLLVLESADVRLAAAQALDIIASSEALVQKRIEVLGLKTDGPAVAKSLRDHAGQLRMQVAKATPEEDAAFDFAEPWGDPFGLRSY